MAAKPLRDLFLPGVGQALHEGTILLECGRLDQPLVDMVQVCVIDVQVLHLARRAPRKRIQPFGALPGHVVLHPPKLLEGDASVLRELDVPREGELLPQDVPPNLVLEIQLRGLLRLLGPPEGGPHNDHPVSQADHVRGAPRRAPGRSTRWAQSGGTPRWGKSSSTYLAAGAASGASGAGASPLCLPACLPRDITANAHRRRELTDRVEEPGTPHAGRLPRDSGANAHRRRELTDRVEEPGTPHAGSVGRRRLQSCSEISRSGCLSTRRRAPHNYLALHA
mmetsp:Transcript_13085/g.46552  ORF Transcript_13085/g.46552 Transcript_13085/m.46552 type:complete len:280 (+) Transcript_13085:1355-2194(+)